MRQRPLVTRQALRRMPLAKRQRLRDRANPWLRSPLQRGSIKVLGPYLFGTLVGRFIGGNPGFFLFLLVVLVGPSLVCAALLHFFPAIWRLH
jgi:hypothetical protein